MAASLRSRPRLRTASPDPPPLEAALSADVPYTSGPPDSDAMIPTEDPDGEVEPTVPRDEDDALGTAVSTQTGRVLAAIAPHGRLASFSTSARFATVSIARNRSISRGSPRANVAFS